MKRTLRFFSLFLLLLFFYANAYSQATTKGTDFWYGYMFNNVNNGPFYTYVSSSSTTTITGTITIPGLSWTQNFTVGPNSTTQITMPVAVSPAFQESMFNLAVHVTSCDSITVYAQSAIPYTNDATVIYPTTALQDQYMVLNWNETGGYYDAGDEFLIVATQNNTQVQITPSIATSGGHPAGVPYTVTLNQGQMYQVTRGTPNTSLTGTKIKSINPGQCIPIAVFSGDNCTDVGPCVACDHLYEQLLPLASLGSDYILPPLKNKATTIYRVMATQNSTSVTINGGPPISLNAGQYYQFSNNIASYVTANLPIMIMQYAQGGSCDGTGDPFEILMYPKDQSINNITFNAFISTIITQYWVNIVVKTVNVGNTLLDGTNISASFSVVPSNTTYSYAQVAISQANHTLTNPGGVLAYVYGWGSYESFGYCAGAALTDLTNHFTAAPNPTCIGSPVNFTAIPDGISTGYQWDFGDASPTDTGLASTHSFGSGGVFVVTLTKQRTIGCDVVIKQNVSIFNPPIEIDQNDTTICFGATIQLSAQADEDSVPVYTMTGCGDTDTTYQAAHFDSLSWSTGDTGSLISITPVSDTVVYVYGHKIGDSCVGVDSVTIHVVKPTANFITGSSCAQDTVCLTDSSFGNPSPITSWNWDFGDGSPTSGTQNPCHLYTAQGSYNVTLIAQDSAGCLDTIIKPVNIGSQPLANFMAPAVCDGDSMLFTDQTSPAATSWHWDFGDGDTSIVQNPSHLYTNAGTYNVKLSVLAGGCSSDTTIAVMVNPLPSDSFTAPAVCVGFPMNFTDNSTVTPGSITGWSWNFGDGTGIATTQNPSYTYTGSGTYTVHLTTTTNNGCTDSTTQNVTVYPGPTADFSVQNSCAGFPVILTDSSTGTIASWAWDIDNNGTVDYTTQNVSHIYPGPGTYQVHLTVTSTNGCVDDTIIPATVISNPVAAFAAPNVCEGNTMPFADQTSPTPSFWHWDFGNGDTSIVQNPTYNYTATGNHTVTLIVAFGACKDTVTHTVTVNPLPIPGFSVVPACPGSPTQFNNSSTPLNTNTYTWDFGDGVGTSTAQSPTYSYTNGGIYTVQLIATSDSGCVDSISHVDTIPYLPVADFRFDTVCLGTQTCFIDSSTVQNSTITGWTWSWGDGAPVGNTQNPCHLYAAAGTYNVIMTPVSAVGCVAANPAIHQISVNNNPIASFTVNNVCQYDAAAFNNTSTNNVINNWDFGDGNTSTAVNPSHQYATANTYTVQLITSSGLGCADTTDTSVTIYPVPTANFSFTNVCDGNPMNFTDNSAVGSGGTINGWSWNFGDGSGTANTQNPSYNYGNAGQYNVTLIATTTDNCTDTSIQQVEVYPNPTADFSPTQVCLNTPTVFSDQSTVSSGNINIWYWNFGDTPPGTSTQQNPTYTYNIFGTFNVTLAISTDHNCVDTVMKTVTVNPNPVADFFSNNRKGCTPWCVNFTDSSNISSGSITNWAWDFGNGNTGSGQNAQSCYTNEGFGVDNYTIILTVTSDEGCTNTETKTNYVSIYPRPKAAFTMDPNPGDIWHNKIQFEDESQGASVWAWNFGDGIGISAIQNPEYIYSDTGTYIVSLNIANQWGCTDSTYNFLRINPKYAVFIPNAFTPNELDGKNDYFAIKGFGLKQEDMYIFDRWGEIIHEGHSLEAKWDGKVNGRIVPPGVYVYKIVVMDVFNNQHTYIGNVSIVR